MYPFIRSTAAAAVLATLAAAPAVADVPKLPMRSGEVATPSALAQGEQYLSISKVLTCGINNCIATVKGRAKKQTVITGISCLTVADNSQILYGAATDSQDGEVALALFPVQSRTVIGTLEHAVVGGASQIVLGPDDSAVFGVVASSAIEQAVCTLTGTTTKQ